MLKAMLTACRLSSDVLLDDKNIMFNLYRFKIF